MQRGHDVRDAHEARDLHGLRDAFTHAAATSSGLRRPLDIRARHELQAISLALLAGQHPGLFVLVGHVAIPAASSCGSAGPPRALTAHDEMTVRGREAGGL